MNANTGLDNVIPDFGREIPRMMSDTDMAVIRKVAAILPEHARIIEYGPWLGGVSASLAGMGELHVVDRFIWTDKNAERLPGVADPGESFLPVFQNIRQMHGFDAVIHEADFQDFEWSGGRVDLCFIDAPRKPAELLNCLMPIAKSLHQGSFVLVKNGLNPAYFEMMSLIEVLLAQSVFELIPVDQPKWCNIAVLKSGAKLAGIHDLGFDGKFFHRNPLNPDVRDPWYGPAFQIARIAQHVSALEWGSAYDQLDRLTPDIAGIYAWDEQEKFLDLRGAEEKRLAAFAEAISFHNDPTSALNTRIPFEKSAALALRTYWKRNRGELWRRRTIDPEMIAKTFQNGFLHWPAKLESHVRQRTVLELGPNLEFSGIGYMIAGADSYLGIETQPKFERAAKEEVEGHRSDLPAWLSDALAELDIVFRIVHYGAPVEGVDFCLLQEGDQAAASIEKTLSAALAANAPKLEHLRIPPDHSGTIVSGLKA